ncbi:Lrp/AsnC family leucine-responsive transcriptional regulator [Aminicella lysinilytica]|uniref:Lrp/AsnC family leucine-responsive transcriptional regulator n=2 Tax=Aminicella lysinilytica TaxID=433323 RepID=A0A4R6Q847_9FIRM|nr:Lrp/AsnC family leucine-responsive transcriptional regulator [Aminicella lysinilytica]
MSAQNAAQDGAATAAYIGAQGGIMDNTDLKILSYLQKNGRASIKEISGQVNLSSPAVTERIKRLEESGVIDGYHADINYLKMGKTVQAFVTVDCDPKKYDTFCAFCENSPLIESHFHIIGPYNAMLHVAVSDSDELAELLGQIQLFGISQTSVILNTLFYRKENIDWGKHKK